MGANYDGQEMGIAELRGMSAEARQYLCHHMRNALNVIVGNLVLVQEDVIAYSDPKAPDRLTAALRAAAHIVEDLEKIGC